MAKFKVTPTNIKLGAKAPYFIIEATNKHESQKEAEIEFATRSNLSRYPEWELNIQKL